MQKLFTFEQFLLEREVRSTGLESIFEGGAAGHMSHPFDDRGLTFGDFKSMIDAGLRGELNFEEDPTEKTDGQNVFATIQDGQVKFARNKTELVTPMDLKTFKAKFEGHPSKLVQDTFQFAAEDLAALLIKLPKATQLETFQNGKNFMNMELIYSMNPNIIHYDVDVIQFHGIKETDGNGNIIGERSKAAGDIAKILKDLNSNVGKKFTVIPPQIIQLRKDLDFEQNKDKFINKVNQLRDRFSLTDSDEVSRYHEMWWREQIEQLFGDLPQDIKEGLLLRWAYDDKKTLNMRDLAKKITKEQEAAVKKFDKEDSAKKYKENIRPFEDLFLELGSVILKNASNFLAVSPDREMQRLHAEIRRESEKIKSSGDLKQIEKVEAELSRLNRIGGIESIIPTEGIVFRYKGGTYKLTGTFAAINSLLGIIRYGR
jgi:hypothetical protein